MTQPAIARFEAGGTTPTLPILDRIANAFDSTVSVVLKPKAVARQDRKCSEWVQVCTSRGVPATG